MMMSPNVLRYRNFSIGFFSDEGSEPIHVHVWVGSDRSVSSKFWVKKDGVELAHNKARIADRDLSKIEKYLVLNRQMIIARWYEYFEM